ncbi:hypothetical protein [Acidimangrovimonas pyrenivorans]|uniref:Uncharacterized protein n=1 Tax=Acidimangrovimonas pyrenivorans TaxID=2030798 RepID=A0ABV7AIL0_9RHOB
MALFPIVILAIFIGMYLMRRNSTLTRHCRWREDRTKADAGEHYFRCMACGGEMRCPEGKHPRDCLRPPAPSH